MALVLAWLLVPVVGAVVASYRAKPLFVPRYLIVCLPALVLLAGRGLSVLPRWPALGATAAMLALAGLALPYLQPDYEEVNFRDATDYILRASRPGDGIVFYRPSRRLGFEYYQEHSGRPAPGLVPLHPSSSFGAFDLTEDYRATRLTPADYARLSSWAGNRRVWLLSSKLEVPPNRTTAERITSTLGAQARLRATREFAGLRVGLYEPAPR